MWEETHGALVGLLEENPELRSRLLDTPLESLEFIDRWWRAKYLEKTGDLAAAASVADCIEWDSVYTPEFNEARRQVTSLAAEVAASEGGMVVDIASGEGGLLRRLAETMGQRGGQLVGSDISVRVLRRNRDWFTFHGMMDPLSLLAFDARQTPFKTGSIPIITTHFGLANILNAGPLLQELRRIASGRFLVTHISYYPDDKVHAEIFRRFGMHSRLDEELVAIESAGWRCRTLLDLEHVRHMPTPESKILPGFGLDAVPVEETEVRVVLLELE